MWRTLVWIDNDHATNTRGKFNDESDTNKAIRVMEGVVNLYGKNLSHLFLHRNFVGGRNRRLFDLVFQNLHQFVSLVLCGGNYIYEDCSTFEMPMLEELILWCVRHRGKQLFAQFDAPKLRRVFLTPLYDEFDDVTPDDPSLPWSQIAHLSIGIPSRISARGGYVSARYFFDLLPRLSCLTYLHIAGVALQKRSTAHPNPDLRLPHLKTLEIFDHRSLLLESPFLTSISTPSLETLDIFFAIAPAALNNFHKTLLPFFQRTPSLRRTRFVAYSDMGTLWGWRSLQQQPFLQLTGDGPFFAHLSHATREGDKKMAQFAKTRSISKKGWLDGELWTDRLIDRYIDEFPIISLPAAKAEVALGGSRCDSRGGEGTTSQADEDGNQSEGGDGGISDSEMDDDGAISLNSGVITEEMAELVFSAIDREHRENIRTILFPLLGDLRIPAHVERHVYVFLDHLQ